jgi:hypothetical protein
MTTAFYSVFNGIDVLKSVSFIGFRTIDSIIFKQVENGNNKRKGSDVDLECRNGTCGIIDLLATFYTLKMEFQEWS